MFVSGAELSISPSSPGTAGRAVHLLEEGPTGRNIEPGWKPRGCDRPPTCPASLIHPGPPHASHLYQHPLSPQTLYPLLLSWPWHGPRCLGLPFVPGDLATACGALPRASTVLGGATSLHPCGSSTLHGRKLRLGVGSPQLGDPGARPQPGQPARPRVFGTALSSSLLVP